MWLGFKVQVWCIRFERAILNEQCERVGQMGFKWVMVMVMVMVMVVDRYLRYLGRGDRAGLSKSKRLIGKDVS